MKKLLMILTVFMTACTSAESPEVQSHDVMHSPISEIPLNNGSKWKTDEATAKNVASMMQVVNDSSFKIASNRAKLSVQLQAQVDTLVKQCSMKGAAHDALHIWLEKLIKDMKQLKENDENYLEVHALLNKDIESFYSYFE